MVLFCLAGDRLTGSSLGCRFEDILSQIHESGGLAEEFSRGMLF